QGWLDRRGLRNAAAVAVLAILVAGARAQLTPDRAYYGIGRGVPMTVNLPAQANATGEAVILLLAPVSGDAKATAPVNAGGVDLAAKFPVLWDATVPRTG